MCIDSTLSIKFILWLWEIQPLFDLKINQLNVNKYAFHKNKFPVEVFLQYAGDKTANAEFTISQGNTVVAKEKLSFSPSKKQLL